MNRERVHAALAKVLTEHGITGNAFGLHDWRCAYADMYGDCDCVERLLGDLCGAVAELWAEHESEMRAAP